MAGGVDTKEIAGRYQTSEQVFNGHIHADWIAIDKSSPGNNLLLRQLKIANPEDVTFQKMFFREVDSVKTLTHPRILPITDLSVSNTGIYVIYPYFSNGSLFKKKQLESMLTENELAKIMWHVSDSLDYLHGKNIVHNRIRPENIMINRDGDYVLADSGFTPKFRSILNSQVSDRDRFYNAPENGGSMVPKNSATDIFALGVMILELTSPGVLTNGSSKNQLSGLAKAPDIMQHYSQPFKMVVSLCLNADPSKRPDAKTIKSWTEYFYKNGIWPTAQTETTEKVGPKPVETSTRKRPKPEKETEVVRSFGHGKSHTGIEFKEKKTMSPIFIYGGGVLGVLALIFILIRFEVFTGSKDSKGELQFSVGREEVSTGTMSSDFNQPFSTSSTTNFSNVIPNENIINGLFYLREGKYNYALDHFEKAINEKAIEANFIAGKIFELGLGQDADLVKAKNYYKAGLIGGDVKASLGLKSMNILKENLIAGGENERDILYRAFTAVKLYAEAGVPFYQSIIGDIYQEGWGVDKDLQNAVQWYFQAANSGIASAQHELAKFYFNGLGDLNRNYREAEKWYKASADKGYLPAYNNLGFMYLEGKGIPQDYAKAREYLEKAAEKGYAPAQNSLGYIYRNGLGVKASDSTAVRWYKLAAEQKNAVAAANLGFMYRNGRGVKKNDQLAAKWYKVGADEGNETAQFNIAFLYDKGIGVAQNWGRAKYYYQLAANQGNVDAMVELGTMYYFGVAGVEKDQAKALKFLGQAASKGKENANLYIKIIKELGENTSGQKGSTAGDVMKYKLELENKAMTLKTGDQIRGRVEFDLRGSNEVILWPTNSPILKELGGKVPTDELAFETFSRCFPYNKDGYHKIYLSSKTPLRSLGYIYLTVKFNKAQPLIIKIPAAVAWI